jgi:hypothetical protein
MPCIVVQQASPMAISGRCAGSEARKALAVIQ